MAVPWITLVLSQNHYNLHTNLKAGVIKQILSLVRTPKEKKQLELRKCCMQIQYNCSPVFLITIQFLLEQKNMQLCLIVQFVPAAWKHS